MQLTAALLFLIALLLLPASAAARLIVGNPGRDTIHGTRHHDVIIADGRDRIKAGGAHDVVIAGFPSRGGKPVKVWGGRGADSIHTSGANDRISGGAGADTIFAGFGRDRLSGGAGRDNLHGQSERDRINGGPGNDHITASKGNDLVRGGSGRDALTGGPGNDLVSGGSDDDAIHLYTGDDRGFGNGGFDWLGGYLGNDLLVGGPGRDIGADGYGRNRIKTEFGRHPALPGHPIYKPHDDRRRARLPHLRGARPLEQAIQRLRQTRSISSWAERDRILVLRSRVFRAAQHAVRLHFHGVQHQGLAILKLEKLQAAFSAELDRLTVDYQFPHHA